MGALTCNDLTTAGSNSEAGPLLVAWVLAKVRHIHNQCCICYTVHDTQYVAIKYEV